MNRPKLNRISTVLLALGFGAAVAIFATARSDDYDPLRDDPFGRKKYAHEMQVIGGKANLLASDFHDWFAGLWHGRALAGTVAVLTVASTLVFRFVATLPPAPVAESEHGEPGKTHR